MPAANRYTTTELLADIKRNGHVVSSQNTFGDTDLLRLADQECQTAILKMILDARENYYLTYTDFAVDTTTFTYNIPLRAIGGAIADIQVISGTIIYPVIRTEVNEQFATNAPANGYYSFYIKGNAVVLPGVINGSIRIWYYRRPNTLVAVASAAQITGIASNVLTFASLPTTITTSTPCDMVKDQPGFDCLSQDVTPTVVTATQLTFASADVPSSLAVGDWVSLAGQTAVPQIPVEFSPILAQRVVCKYYEIQGYLDKLKAAEAKLKEIEDAVMAIINPRVAEAPKRIVASSELIGGNRRWRMPVAP